MKEKFVVVGVGGTGSYFINNLINYLNGKRKNTYKVVLVDGDVLEDRNLLRQGFLKKDIGKNKSKVLAERFDKIAMEHVDIEFNDFYIRDINDLQDIIGEGYDRITLVSCVDNNMARLRILLAQYTWFFKNNKDIHFIDGGNSEWEGQVIINKIEKGEEPPVIFDGEEMKYNDKNKTHKSEMIFKGNSNWRQSLSRGDFELSCDEITESAPQNILANMTSAVSLLRRVFDRKNVRLQFDVSMGLQEELEVEESDNEILKDIISFVNTDGKSLIYYDGEDDEVESNEGHEELERLEEDNILEKIEEELEDDYGEDELDDDEIEESLLQHLDDLYG